MCDAAGSSAYMDYYSSCISDGGFPGATPTATGTGGTTTKATPDPTGTTSAAGPKSTSSAIPGVAIQIWPAYVAGMIGILASLA